jgi:hypothetical protein
MFDKIKVKKIEYSAVAKHVGALPKSKNKIPEWYKKTEKTYGGPLHLGKQNKTFKYCFPFLDALSSGYMLETVVDLQVVIENGKQEIFWGSSPVKGLEVIGERDSGSTGMMPTPEWCSEIHFYWSTFYNLKCPKGYSLLVTHPLNRYDLPFITLSGIVDADQGLHPGRMPFFLRKDFEGIIEAGTPIAQIIPIKRESWQLEKNTKYDEQIDQNVFKTNSTFFGWYKKNIWQKKEYN